MRHPGVLIGLFIFLVGSVFAYAMGSEADFTSLIHFRKTDPVVQGTVLKVLPTGSSSGDKVIYDYHYQYQLAGRQFEGHSYAHGGRAQAGEAIRYATHQEDHRCPVSRAWMLRHFHGGWD